MVDSSLSATQTFRRGVEHMKDEDRIEIRLLGRLYVRRGDGSVVEPSEWRTGKTVDLLRLLALEADQPVRIASLLDKLWPDVDETRGRASLRTAASQIRRTLRADCVERELGGLVLRNAWVDVTSFRALATEARSSLRSREFARVVALAREAEGLYLKDFEAQDDGSSWALEVRESLAAVRRTMLADAAESAVELHWVRDGIELAKRAIEADPCSERPHRTLMQAYAALGETEQALRAFDHCRQMLADELGADPSAQTRAVHMQILSGYVEVGTNGHVFVGREPEIVKISTALEESLSDGPQMICIAGPAGSGREALLAESLTNVAAKCVRPNLVNGSVLPSKRELQRLAKPGEQVVVVLGEIDSIDPHEVTEFKRALSGLDRSAVAVAAPVSVEVGEQLSEKLGRSLCTLHVDSLTGEDLQALARTLLSGPVTNALVEALHRETSGLAGHAVATLRRWSSTGQVISTAAGLELVPAGAGDDLGSEVGSLIRRVLEQLTPEEMNVIHLVALINAPVVPATLMPLVPHDGDDPGHIRAILDRLVDLGALQLEGNGYLFRHPVMRDATEAWIRPSMRRLLHRQIAESRLTGEDFASHWMKAGEPSRATEAAIEAAEWAHAQGRQQAASAHLSRAAEFAVGLSSVPHDYAALLEKIGDSAGAMHLPRKASRAYETALAAARAGGLPSAGHLEEKAMQVALEAAMSEHLVPMAASPIPPQRGWGAALEEQIRRTLTASFPGWNFEISLSMSETPEKVVV